MVNPKNMLWQQDHAAAMGGALSLERMPFRTWAGQRIVFDSAGNPLARASAKRVCALLMPNLTVLINAFFENLIKFYDNLFAGYRMLYQAGVEAPLKTSGTGRPYADHSGSRRFEGFRKVGFCADQFKRTCQRNLKKPAKYTCF
jgi:hypothetical protein